MTVDELVDDYPRRHHMATGGAWPTIRQHGLLPTASVVATSGLTTSQQDRLLTLRRANSTTITHPVIGTVTIRDQAPLREQILGMALTDMTVGQWLNLLNDRVFFWLHPDGLRRLLNARRYRKGEQDVLEIDTRLVVAYRDGIRLSPINCAVVHPAAGPCDCRLRTGTRRTTRPP
jgi:hypothetical protein